MYLDSVDRKLLNFLQVEFPLTREPYADLGLRLGIDGGEVIHRIRQLKTGGIIRQISPVLDARRLGYQTTLVAMKVAESRLDKAAQLIIEHPGISHGYERDHGFNLWFTLSISPTANMERELEQLTASAEAEAVLSLPAVKLFKIGAYFALDGDSPPAPGSMAPRGGTLPEATELSPLERWVINELQQDLPLIPAPFSPIAERLNMSVEDFLAQCQSLQQRGIMRRFGAAINHRRAGFRANAMTCWVAPPERVDIVGRKLASLREVSHCYERKTNPLWSYNLFAMLHGQTKETCQEIADRVSDEFGLSNYVLLFSTREFKKTRVRYLV